MLKISQRNAFGAARCPLVMSKGPSQALRHPNSSENAKSSVLPWENLHFSGAIHPVLHLISPPCGPKFHREPHSKLPLRRRVPIGALVKTLAGAVPEAQIRPVAHSMRPNLSNISRFQSIAVVQPRARGLYEHFFVFERLFGIFCQPQAMESSVSLRENQWLALRSGQR